MTSKINKICTVTNSWVFSKCLYPVLVLQSFYQVSVHSTVCRQLSVVCAFSEVMASTGRAGPDRAFYSPGRAGPGQQFSARAAHY